VISLVLIVPELTPWASFLPIFTLYISLHFSPFLIPLS
jgi:hypothetical protein